MFSNKGRKGIRHHILKNCLLCVLAFAVLLMSFAACTPEKADFPGQGTVVITTDITDGVTVSEKAFRFTASAVCGDAPCGIEVNCNGILLAENEGSYTAALRSGENVIEITASGAGKTETKQYRVTYRADFEFIGDPGNASVRNDTITFSLSATFNDAPCALAVTCNGEILTPGEGDVYTARLRKGENTIVGIARSGEHIKTGEWKIEYGEFVLSTDLSERTCDSPELSFRAAAQYGGDICTLRVLCNGEEVTPATNKYTVTLREGENTILICASADGAEKQYAYSVKYVNAPPVLSVGIGNDRTYRGSVFSFDVIARDGIGEKLSADCISFAVDLNAADGVEQFIPCSDISLVWDDSAMTSFRIYFNKGIFGSLANQSFILCVIASDSAGRTASQSFVMTYTPAGEGESIGKVTFAMEGFSIGCGYFIEPMHLEIYEGVPFSKTLTDLLTSRGLSYTGTGTLEKGFYLASVSGLNLLGNRIADGIWERVKNLGYTRSIEAGGSLGEFNYGSGSGWMYSVNGVYKNFGFADYYPQDGDVVRVQFTVLLGEDLGGGGALGGGSSGSMLTDNPDYAPILKILADIAECSADKSVYYEVLDAISVWDLSASAMAEQLAKVRNYYGALL